MLVLKDELRPHLKPGSSGGGGKEFQLDKYLTESNPYPSRLVFTIILIYSQSFISAAADF